MRITCGRSIYTRIVTNAKTISCGLGELLYSGHRLAAAHKNVVCCLYEIRGCYQADALIAFMKFHSAILLCVAVLQLVLTASEGKANRDSFYSEYPRVVDHAPVATVGRRATCEPESDEYFDRIAFLTCEKSFLRAVEAEMEGSYCRNIYYSSVYDYEDFCGDLPDERENVSNCSAVCSGRVLYFMFCTTVGEQYAEISRECGDTLDRGGYCSFDRGEFCFNHYNSTIVLVDECSPTNSQGELECREECRDAIETYVEGCGRIMNTTTMTEHYISDIFWSRCRLP